MTPYQSQLDAVQAAIDKGNGGIIMPTGTGKSIAMALLIQKLQVKTLCVVPSLELKKQLSETFINLFGSLKNIVVENIDSPRLQSEGDYGLLILDECHKSASATYQKLNKKYWTNIYHRYFFSATMFRNDPEEELLLEGIIGRLIYALSYAAAVKNTYIVPLEAYYIESPKQKTDAFTYAQVYSELVVNNTAKNTMLAKLLTSLHSSGKSTLCLVKEIAHGEALQELTGLPFVNGQDIDSRKYIKRFNEGALKVLIGTTGVLSEGVDTRACEYVVIAGSGKAKSQFMQACGRGMRNFPGKESAKVILIKDKSHKYLMRHFSAQVKILLAEYGAIPVKLEI